MGYLITYDLEYKRTIPAVLIENRANIPEIKNQIGVVIKRYVDMEVGMVAENVLPYRVETYLGVLVGYFTVQISNIGQNATKLQQVLRPQFQEFIDISQNINNFITNGGYIPDILL